VEVAERYAGGQATVGELTAARETADAETDALKQEVVAESWAPVVVAAAWVIEAALAAVASEVAPEAPQALRLMADAIRASKHLEPGKAAEEAWVEQRRLQADVLRKELGYPSRP